MKPKALWTTIPHGDTLPKSKGGAAVAQPANRTPRRPSRALWFTIRQERDRNLAATAELERWASLPRIRGKLAQMTVERIARLTHPKSRPGRKSPLARSASLKCRPFSRQTTRIRHETPSRAAEQRRYRAAGPKWLGIGTPYQLSCLVCLKLGMPEQPATQRHHKYGKRGRLLNWKLGWLPVSDFGQRWIHDHPAKAYSLGLLGPVGTWNDFNRARAHAAP